MYSKKRHFTIILVTILVVMVSFNVSAEKEFRNPRLNLQGTSLNGFTGQSSVLFPLENRKNSILYTDFRSRISEDEASEWNLGLGYRYKSKKYENRLNGIYIYRDRREEFNHTWDMWTIGGEILTDSFDLRLNGYLTDNEKVAIPQGDTVVIEDNKIIYQKGYVQSMDGIDFEFGKRFIEADGLLHNVGAYLKIYTFFADEVDNMYGKEIKLNKLVGNREGTNYKFGVEWQEDNTRGSNLNASFEVSIPFGASEKQEKLKKEDKTEIIETRMTEKPERDVDVVVGESKTGTKEAGGTVAYDPATGNKLDDTKYISADTEDIVTKINESDAKVIVLLGNKGEFNLNGSIKLDKGQKLLSPTGSLLVSADTKGSRATYYKPEGKQAKVNFKSYNDKGGLVLEKYNTVSGLKMVDNSNNSESKGIYKDTLDVDNAPDIRDNSISKFDIGIYFEEIKGEKDRDKLNNLARFNTEYENSNKISGTKFVDVHDHIVKDWYDLDSIRYNMDGVYLMKSNLGSNNDGYNELTSETANENSGWEPLGNSTDKFTGYFDGQSYVISDLYIDRSNEDNVGLFGIAGNNSVLGDVGLEDANIEGNSGVGGLVGRNNGSISNSYATGKVNGEDFYVGGLVGENYGDIKNSYSTVEVTGNSLDVGGLVARNVGDIENSYASGEVNGNNYVGGLVSWNDGGNILNSFATGNVNGNDYISGLVGDNRGTISNSYATGKVNGNDDIGGLVGENYGDISNSYATGDVTGNSEVGGLVGLNYEGRISNSYATGKVAGVEKIGGLVGNNDSGSISESYATGDVNGDKYNVGGLVGENQGKITKSYATGDVTGNYRVGGLVGLNVNGGEIINSSATGNVTGDEYIGGLIGRNVINVLITHSYATGSVTGNLNTGGLVGWNSFDAIITYSYATGDVTGNDRAGGLVGYNEQGGEITNSSATGNVSASRYVGGLVGLNHSYINNSYATGSVTGDYFEVGGLVGVNDAIITKSYATGDVTGNDRVGGLVGVNDHRGEIINSYATGNVIGNEPVGGLVGGNNGDILYSYATGDVSGDGEYIGGLVGYNSDTVIDSISLGPTNAIGYDVSSLKGRVTKAPAQDMKVKDLYTNDNFKDYSPLDSPWDFDTIWKIDEDTTSPYLQNNTPEVKPIPE